MTEEQAVERIARAITNIDSASERQYPYCQAQAAWNEMKVIARENPAWPVPVWRNDMTMEEARQRVRDSFNQMCDSYTRS